MSIQSQKSLVFLFFVCFLFFLTACSSQPTQEEYIIMQFTPMQCVSTPWNEWFEETSQSMFSQLSSVDILRLYYTQELGINIRDIQRVYLDTIVCEACFVCAKEYIYVASVSSLVVSQLERLGWSAVFSSEFS